MLETGKMYHLYNRGNNRENLFYKKENYHYFIRQFDKYLSSFVDVYAYCLLPNHFHFLIKIKEEDEIFRNIREPSLKAIASLSLQVRLYQNNLGDFLLVILKPSTSKKKELAVYFKSILKSKKSITTATFLNLFFTFMQIRKSMV